MHPLFVLHDIVLYVHNSISKEQFETSQNWQRGMRGGGGGGGGRGLTKLGITIT